VLPGHLHQATALRGCGIAMHEGQIAHHDLRQITPFEQNGGDAHFHLMVVEPHAAARHDQPAGLHVVDELARA